MKPGKTSILGKPLVVYKAMLSEEPEKALSPPPLACNASEMLSEIFLKHVRVRESCFICLECLGMMRGVIDF